MKDLESLIRELHTPQQATEVAVRLSNGERWSFNADSELFGPDRERIPFGDLHGVLVNRAVPYVTYRGRWTLPEDEEGDSWKIGVVEGPRQGRCDIDFLTDQIVRVSKLYTE
ncbi:MAG: hypothetical protein H0X52_07120 [Gemmatimonadetes bacterium]|nr:hypothetical protein [Gemmatimonadota bacterium]